MRNIMRKDLELFPYKIQIIQSYNIHNLSKRSLSVCRWDFDVVGTDAHAFQYVWFSNASHFLLLGHVCNQNMIFWASEQCHCFAEKPLHSEKITVRCAMLSHVRKANILNTS